MLSETSERSEDRLKPRRAHSLLAAAAVVAVIALFQARDAATSLYQERAQAAGLSTLLLVSEAVDQTVGRFKPIPGLIAGDPDLREMLGQNIGTRFSPFMNEKLRQIAISVGASDVYVLDPTGLTVSASN